jgi:hypothetical protein
MYNCNISVRIHKKNKQYFLSLPQFFPSVCCYRVLESSANAARGSVCRARPPSVLQYYMSGRSVTILYILVSPEEKFELYAGYFILVSLALQSQRHSETNVSEWIWWY